MPVCSPRGRSFAPAHRIWADAHAWRPFTAASHRGSDRHDGSQRIRLTGGGRTLSVQRCQNDSRRARSCEHSQLVRVGSNDAFGAGRAVPNATLSDREGSNLPVPPRMWEGPEAAHPARFRSLRRRSLNRTYNRHSGPTAGTGLHAPKQTDSIAGGGGETRSLRLL